MDYKNAGVDVEAGYEAVSLMKEHVKRTMNPRVLKDIGSFGGFYDISGMPGIDEPVLVAGTDGVGTKLKIAFALDKHDTVGIDCVAMCVNDIICQGAKPLLFLDYIAQGKLIPGRVADIVKGVSDGCLQAGAALIGGETAEMPGFYPEDEYDLAGFAVGIADKKKVIVPGSVKEGDALIGLASSGLHSNGFSLVRKLIPESRFSEYSEKLGKTFGEELLTPTRIYVKTILSLIDNFKVHGVANITGGGFIENIPRIFPEGLSADIFLGSWPVHPIFDILREAGDMTDGSIYNTFNMGIGMVIAAPEASARDIVDFLTGLGEKAYIIGRASAGDKGVRLCS